MFCISAKWPKHPLEIQKRLKAWNFFYEIYLKACVVLKWLKYFDRSSLQGKKKFLQIYISGVLSVNLFQYELIRVRVRLTVTFMKQEIATFFMDVVNSSHTYATGGTSVSEFW